MRKIQYALPQKSFVASFTLWNIRVSVFIYPFRLTLDQRFRLETTSSHLSAAPEGYLCFLIRKRGPSVSSKEGVWIILYHNFLQFRVASLFRGVVGSNLVLGACLPVLFENVIPVFWGMNLVGGVLAWWGRWIEMGGRQQGDRGPGVESKEEEKGKEIGVRATE